MGKRKESRGGDARLRLRKYCMAGRQIEYLVAELRRNRAHEEAMTLGLQARPLDGMPRGKGGRADPTLRAVEALWEKSRQREADLLRRIRELTREREEVDGLLERLESKERQIIRLRWMEEKSWVQVAMRLFLSERQCQRIHKRGLERMEEMAGAGGRPRATVPTGAWANPQSAAPTAQSSVSCADSSFEKGA